MAKYFYRILTVLKQLPCKYEIKVLNPADFADCQTPKWSDALCEERKNLDVSAVAAYEYDKIIVWPDVLLIVIPCGKQVQTFCRSTGVKVLPQH